MTLIGHTSTKDDVKANDRSTQVAGIDGDGKAQFLEIDEGRIKTVDDASIHRATQQLLESILDQLKLLNHMTANAFDQEGLEVSEV